FLRRSPDDVVELRALGGDVKGLAVRIADVGEAINSAPPAKGLYLVANAGHNPSICRSSWGRLGKGEACKDTDVADRRVLLVDFDPERPDKDRSNATEEERQRARELAGKVRQYLDEECDVPFDAIASIGSGNGHQLQLALDRLPNDDATKERCK